MRDGGSAAAVQMLHHNKQDAVKNQGDGNGLIIIKKGIQRIVKQKSDDACRNACDQNLGPERPGLLFLYGAFLEEKGFNL